MKHCHPLTAALALAAGLGFGAAQATTIVNLDATKSSGPFGSETYDAPISVSLGAGSYSLSVIDNTAHGGFNGYNYNTGPAVREAFDVAVNGGPIYSVDVGSGNYTNFDSAAAGIAAFAKGPYSIYTFNGNNTATFVTTLASLNFTLTAPTTLTFGIPDHLFGDNKGGVSLSISAVPEPETYALMLAGLGILAVTMRRRRSA